METINNQANLKQTFSGYVTDPVNILHSESATLEKMIQKFPYCQLLHAFSCKIHQDIDPAKFELLVQKAAVYAPDRKILFSIIHEPETFKAINYADQKEKIELNEKQVQDLAELSEVPVTDAEIIETVEYSENEDDSYIEIIEEDLIEPVETPAQKIEIDDEEKILLENIASADFFAFEKKLTYQTNEHVAQRTVNINPAEAEPAKQEKQEIAESSIEKQEVSRYDDDQMPYSFLWWLHKTRKEHADTYQPYVEFKLDTSKGIQKTTGEELDHQIKENIFHLQSPLDDIEKKSIPNTIHFELRRKEEVIIEKFIREEPQIKPPAPNKLDNENKARKSAEDTNDLVSETLATIYSEQMLFHKAIDTYKKLSLKFPEKRAYFADQIRELEKKIN
ncbi:hypothetical protein [Daejeonella oryzae]|uniref:hypothetical protein n=1 Tax=Daejeonella oryzae TaxID=1122943 RepID=UPI0003FC50E7|nr:hypothetical protein [Daejeonella oryzae]